MLRELEHLRELRKDLLKQLRKLAQSERYKESVKLLQSAPCIGMLTAIRLVMEWGDLSRFARKEEFASLLRDCGSIFSSVMDALVKGSNAITKDRSDFGDYRVYLKKQIPDIHRRTLQVRPRFPAGMIIPFEALQDQTGTPGWWIAYNRIKHSEYDEFRSGNLEHSLTALAAIALLGFFMSWFISDQLFVNVGIVYPERSIDMTPERRLFITD
ncbi:MAG: transposase [Dehalococcoidales bacterium]|nr:transposase [Dehalococcoidales bacterium]